MIMPSVSIDNQIIIFNYFSIESFNNKLDKL